MSHEFCMDYCGGLNFLCVVLDGDTTMNLTKEDWENIQAMDHNTPIADNGACYTVSRNIVDGEYKGVIIHGYNDIGDEIDVELSIEDINYSMRKCIADAQDVELTSIHSL